MEIVADRRPPLIDVLPAACPVGDGEDADEGRSDFHNSRHDTPTGPGKPRGPSPTASSVTGDPDAYSGWGGRADDWERFAQNPSANPLRIPNLDPGQAGNIDRGAGRRFEGLSGNAPGNPVLDPGQIGNLDIRLEEARNRLEKLEGKTEQLPLIRMSGFFQVDDGLFSHSPSSQAYYGDIQDGVGFRRARLSAVGKLTEFTNFSIEFDFAQIGRPSFFIWGEQEQIPILGTVRIGQFRRARDPPGSKKDDDVKSKDPKADAKKKEAPPPVGRCDQCGGCEGVRKVCVAKMIEKEIKKVCWDAKGEDFCIPGPARPAKMTTAAAGCTISASRPARR